MLFTPGKLYKCKDTEPHKTFLWYNVHGTQTNKLRKQVDSDLFLIFLNFEQSKWPDDFLYKFLGSDEIYYFFISNAKKAKFVNCFIKY